MKKFLLSRLAEMVISLIAMSALIFFLVRLTGDPLDLLLPIDATEKDRAILAHHLGLDKPLTLQYVLFITRAVQGDFGESLQARRPALELVFERFPATLQLGSVAILWSLILGIPIGVYSARWRGGTLDSVGKLFSILGQASPIFWLGLILIYIFSVQLHWLPTGGRGSWKHLLLPAFTMGWYTSAGLMRLTRSSMLDVLDSEYIKLARAKGLSDRMVVWKHAFRNAAIPVITFAVMFFVIMLSGAVIVETVFAWPGVGRLMIDAVRWRDFPVVQAVVIILAAMYIGANFFVDILYAYVNPKIRYEKK
jgi:peptide/nickel transport system permease protein